MLTTKIRPANVHDMPQIHGLVKELARYENAPSEVTTTPESYVIDFKNKHFDCLVAEQANSIVGIALYYIAFSTWKGKMLYLEDFVVLPNQRGNGIGQLLFDQLIIEAKKINVSRIKWQVLDWNTPAIEFYKKYNATFDKEWWNGDLFLS